MRTNTGRRYVVPLVWLFCVLTSVIFLQPKVNAADSWNSVGTPGFSNPTQFLTSAMDGDTPYVAFRDWGNGYKLSVMKYNGSTWEFVGSPAFYSGADVANSIVIHAGVPYVGFADGNNGGKATVMRFNGSSWEFVGSPNFNTHSIDNSLYGQAMLKINNHTPYVVFRDLSMYSVSVMR